MGGYDIDLELFEPLLKPFEQCKGAKTLSKSASFTLTTLCNSDSLAQETYGTTRRPDSGFKALLTPQIKALTVHVADFVNFGFSVCLPFVLKYPPLFLTPII